MMDGPWREAVYPALAALLDPPDEGFRERLEAARRASAFDPATEAHLEALWSAMVPLTRGERAELHARTFELNPTCVLYLSVHLFGEESFKRAALMTGLDDAYRAAGFARGGELPDHLGVVLKFSPRFSDEEWGDLLRLCLIEPTKKMRESLAPSDNPYRYLLDAISGMLALEAAREVSHA